MGSALRFYAIYGDNSYYLRRHSIGEIKAANIPKLLQKFKEGTNYAATVHYVGNLDTARFKDILLENYTLNQSGKREPMTFVKAAQYKDNHVY